MKPFVAAVLALASLSAFPAPAFAAKSPVALGHCTITTIKEVNYRLQDMPDSGSLVVYGTGTVGVDYGTVSGIVHSRVGDKVELCLSSIPEDCPRGDDRGKVYAAINLRTQDFWELPDAEHSCGGA